jgi:hypothetical protein
MMAAIERLVVSVRATVPAVDEALHVNKIIPQMSTLKQGAVTKNGVGAHRKPEENMHAKSENNKQAQRRTPRCQIWTKRKNNRWYSRITSCCVLEGCG